MLLIRYETENHFYELARNNPYTGTAEVKAVHGSEITYLIPDDGGIQALMSLAREVPNAWHVVPNPKPRKREVFGRMVL